jgi:hypothetical protein
MWWTIALALLIIGLLGAPFVPALALLTIVALMLAALILRYPRLT